MTLPGRPGSRADRLDDCGRRTAIALETRRTRIQIAIAIDPGVGTGLQPRRSAQRFDPVRERAEQARVERLGEAVGHRSQTQFGRHQWRGEVDFWMHDELRVNVIGHLSQTGQLRGRDHTAEHRRWETPRLTFGCARHRLVRHGRPGTLHRGGSGHDRVEALASHARLEVGSGGDDHVMTGDEQRSAQRDERREQPFHRRRTAKNPHTRLPHRHDSASANVTTCDSAQV